MARSKRQQFDADDAEYERTRELLQSHVSDFAEQHDVPLGLLALVLLEVAVMSRMTEYVVSVEKPSAAGLKRDIDRLRRDLDDFVRHCKRSAEGFIRHMTDELQTERETQARAAKSETKAAPRPRGKQARKRKR